MAINPEPKPRGEDKPATIEEARRNYHQRLLEAVDHAKPLSKAATVLAPKPMDQMLALIVAAYACAQCAARDPKTARTAFRHAVQIIETETADFKWKGHT